MASLTGTDLIRIHDRSKEATMTTKLVALVLLCLVTGTAMAQEPKVTPLMSKDLAEFPGKEALMITVEHVPGVELDAPAQCAALFTYWRALS